MAKRLSRRRWNSANLADYSLSTYLAVVGVLSGEWLSRDNLFK